MTPHILSLLLALTAIDALGADIRLAWDANDPADNVTNYVLYASTNVITGPAAPTNAVVRINAGTNLLVKAEALTPGRWWFCVTAVAAGPAESDISNVIAIEVPKPPGAMRVIALQYSGTLSNFTDVGFFKLRIP